MSQQGNRSAQLARQGSLVPLLLVLLALAALGAAVAITLWSGARASKAAPGSRPVAVGAPPSAATATQVTAEDGVVRLPVADFADGRARFYTYKGAGKTITFFVLQAPDGTIRAAFDACDVCYASRRGYRQDGDMMICNNCGNRFPSSSINVEVGGCNPGPLNREVQGDMVIIRVEDIEEGGRYF
jgi:uncharacterized membrane protein